MENIVDASNLKVFSSNIKRGDYVKIQNVMDNKYDLKVFSSNIERGQKQINNNLYELLQLEPAKPKSVETQTIDEVCVYTPSSGKCFTPKKRIKGRKVKTVRDIRNEFEKDVNTYIPEELMRQETVLFKRIRNGSSKDEDTINFAKNMLKCGHPISRSTWQMLTNLNPDKNLHSEQYVLWNGKRLRVSGSRGGEKNFICHYDLAKKKISVNTKSWSKKKSFLQKRNLLKISLALDLKPGPLSRKKKLDNSYQKNHVGELQPVKLPQIGLELEPAIGVTIEPTIRNILQSLHEINGKLTKTWAEFAVSTLCNLNNSEVMLINNETVTFNLNYHNNQSKVLMRCDGVKPTDVQVADAVDSHISFIREREIDTVVKLLVDDVLTAVDISLNQENLYTGIDEPRDTTPDEVEIVNSTTLMKERIRKKFNELERLDVTVIRLSDSGDIEKGTLSCNKAFCALGCVCSSLEFRYNIKTHCGRVDCMFECKCDFSRYKALNSLDGNSSDLIPGLINLDSKINSRLAKEEKKFHQTVVVTQEKSILLKSQRRNLKAPKRYAEFFNSGLKGEQNERKFLSVSALRLDCVNIEPWCMVHNLYQCFCQGIFTECLKQESANEINSESRDLSNDLLVEMDSDNINSNALKLSKLAGRRTHEKYNHDNNRINRYSSSSDGVLDEPSSSYRTSSCARTKPYRCRKFSDKHYKETNAVIMEMEKNDVRLHRKMMSYISTDKYNVETLKETSSGTESDLYIHNLYQSKSINATSRPFPSRAKLVSWLEANYKNYKQRLEQNRDKIIPLEAPKPGKIALYPWEVILDRYNKRKNFFVVSKDEPYRVFMAVDLNKPFFTNCVAVDQIQFEDLKKYPITVRNLLQDAFDLKDSFYIMGGLKDCWELIGSVTKLKERSDSETSDNNIDHPVMMDKTELEQQNIIQDSGEQSPESDSTEKKSDTINDKSKWFAMTIYYDFSEIQFYSRGFFVKYDSIIKAIDVARVSGKTVRLSSQKFAVDNESPQFGIYAIPHPSKNQVYVGPYEIDEELGMETIDISFNQPSEKSRGVWFTTKKNDNVNVIDNPMEYMPQMDIDGIVVAEKHKSTSVFEPESKKRRISEQNEKKVVNKKQKSARKKRGEKKKVKITVHEEIPEEVPKRNFNDPLHFQPILPNPVKSVKVVKPIKISKNNGFYQLCSSGRIQQVSLLKSPIKSPEAVQPLATVLKPSTLSLFTSETTTIPLTVVKPSTSSLFTSETTTVPSTVVKPSTSSLFTSETMTLPATVIIPSTSSLFTSETMTIPVIKNTFSLSDTLNTSTRSLIKANISKRPVAEIAPQKKIVPKTVITTQEKSRCGGMFVLRPEEINERFPKNNIVFHQTEPQSKESESIVKEEASSLMNMDIENFLATSEICTAPSIADVYVVDDEDSDKESLHTDSPKDVFIECQNIENIGWVKGKRNKENEISFEFPGFKFTDFYKEDEAFVKINQVLSRKVYVPKHINIEWHVIEAEEDLTYKNILKAEDLGSDIVLTRRGLQHKRDLLSLATKEQLKTDLIKFRNAVSASVNVEEASKVFEDLQQQSQTLESELSLPQTESLRENSVLYLLSQAPENVRKKLNDDLKALIE